MLLKWSMHVQHNRSGAITATLTNDSDSLSVKLMYPSDMSLMSLMSSCTLETGKNAIMKWRWKSLHVVRNEFRVKSSGWKLKADCESVFLAVLWIFARSAKAYRASGSAFHVEEWTSVWERTLTKLCASSPSMMLKCYMPCCVVRK